MRNKNVVELMGKEKFIKSVLEKGDEICAFERPVIREVVDDQFLLEVKIVQNRRSYLLFSGAQPISYSRLFVLDRKNTVREVKKKIFALFRPLIKCPMDLA
jgi:hypothetical protein